MKRIYIYVNVASLKRWYIATMINGYAVSGWSFAYHRYNPYPVWRTCIRRVQALLRYRCVECNVHPWWESREWGGERRVRRGILVEESGGKRNSGGGRRASFEEKDVREDCMHAWGDLLDARQISREFLKWREGRQRVERNVCSCDEK